MLAGGRGERLGGRKALVELGGRPLIEYPLAALAEAGLEALVCAKPGEEIRRLRGSLAGPGATAQPRDGVRLLEEPAQPRHPLCGIVAALRAAEGRPIVLLACDLPFVPAGLVHLLAEAPEPLVLPAPGGRPQPLFARYASSLLPRLEAALEREEPLVRTVEPLRPRLLGTEELKRFGDPERIFFNVNAPKDLRHAASLL